MEVEKSAFDTDAIAQKISDANFWQKKRVGNFSFAVRQSEGLTQLFLSGDPRQMLTLAAGARKPNWPAPPRRLTPKHNPPENTKQIWNQNTNKYKTKLQTNTKITSALRCFVPNQKPTLPITNKSNKSLYFTTWKSSDPTPFFPNPLLNVHYLQWQLRLC